jgi:hypothetical protein
MLKPMVIAWARARDVQSDQWQVVPPAGRMGKGGLTDMPHHVLMQRLTVMVGP